MPELAGRSWVDPSAPEYWWLYALLLSTVIPNLVSLVIEGTSLVRGLPAVTFFLLLRYTPSGVACSNGNGYWIATVLTTQVAAGAALGIAAQAFIVWSIIGHVMPFLAWSCSTWPPMWRTSICRRGSGSSLGSACSGSLRTHQPGEAAPQNQGFAWVINHR
jgi:hypothetical protein